MISNISLYDLYGLNIYEVRSRRFGTRYDIRGTILKLQGVPLFRGARGVLVDLGCTSYELRGTILKLLGVPLSRGARGVLLDLGCTSYDLRHFRINFNVDFEYLSQPLTKNGQPTTNNR
jgi:hypothetical protein